MTEGGAEIPAAAEPFVAELKHWRDVSGLSRKALATKMGYDPSYVTKIESGSARPTEMFALRADDVLRTGGARVGGGTSTWTARPGSSGAARHSVGRY